jgi:pimeloyl-ACP methyl ester carboxylesterase
MQPFREFEVQGQRIAATLHVPESTLAPGVIMCHGFTGHRIEAHFLFVKAARALCQAGLNVLRFDFRGSGESDGLFEEMTIEGEITDAVAALDALCAEPTVEESRVGVIGLSLGGLVAACLAGRDERVKSLVLWAAVADLPGVFQQREGLWSRGADACVRREGPVEQPGVRGVQGAIEHGAHRIGEGFVRDCQRVRPLAEVAAYRGPALVVHGGADESVPPHHADMYMEALRTEDKAKHIVKEADHTFTSIAWEADVIEVTRGWLSSRL